MPIELSPGVETIGEKPAVQPPADDKLADLFTKAAAIDEEQGLEPSDDAKEAMKKAKAAVEPDSQHKEDTGRDEKGRFLPRSKEKPPPEAEAEPGAADLDGQADPKAEAGLSKEEKDASRYDRNWQTFQKEKEEWRQIRETQEQQLRDAQIQLQQQYGQPRAKAGGFTAPEYRKYSQDFFADAQRQQQAGEIEQANTSLANAYKALHAAQNLEMYEYQQRGQMEQQTLAQQYDYNWRHDMEKTIQSHPEAEVGGELESAIKEVITFLPEVYYLPGGFEKTYEMAKLLNSAYKAEALAKENEELKSRLGITERKLQPAVGGARSGMPSEKSFKEMSQSEREAHLESIAREADEQGLTISI